MYLDRPVGIDLGTTNSAIAMLSPDGHEIVLYEDRHRRKTMPSVVGWDPEADGYVTGWEAWNRRAMEPAPVTSIKRKMGSQQEIEVGPHRLLPEEISAKILARLGHEMGPFVDARYEEDEIRVGRALITVPAYFEATQIEATRRAGEMAGLEVVSLVQEPTAAAMYYAWKHGIGDGTFLVYDLGGGTFDVSVIRSLSGEYQVLGIAGDNYLGGDDFDRRLAEHFRRHLVERGYSLDLDVAGDPEDAVRFLLLTRLAQEVKEALSTSEVQYVGRREIFDDQDGQPVTLELEVSRTEFEAMIEDLVDQSVEACHEALSRAAEAADVTLAEVDHVLLVGGSTRVPLVQRKVAEALCGPERSKAARPLLDEPDTCVALGAAIHASNVGGLQLRDEERGATMTITSPTYTHTNQARIVGRVGFDEADDASAISSLAVLGSGGDVAAVVRTEESDDEGEVCFEVEELRLPDEGAWRFDLELCDPDGDPLVGFTLPLYRGSADAYRPTGGALSNPTVLARDLYLEVVRDGRSARQILLDRGTSLPADGSFRFFTSDQSGAVILRLFQSRFPIRTIHLQIPPETEVGTPVDLELTVDETMTIVAGGEVAGQKFWAQIEPPPEREARDWQAIEALLEQVDAVERALWGYEARYFRSKADPLVAGIRETARTDPDKLQALARRLDDLLEDYHARDAELTPGWGRMITLLDAIRRVVFRGEGSRQLGLSTEEWRERLEQMSAQATEAYQARDQVAWTNTFDQVQAVWESIAQDEFRFTAQDAGEHVRRLAAGLHSELDELRGELHDFNLSSNAETAALQRAEIDRLEDALNEKVQGPLGALDLTSSPAQLKPQLDRLYEIAQQVRKRLEALPTLGLVSR